MGCKRFLLNMVCFSIGLLLPLLFFRPAMAGTYDCSSATPVTQDIVDVGRWAFTTGDHMTYDGSGPTYEYVVGDITYSTYCTSNVLPSFEWSTSPPGFIFRSQGDMGGGSCNSVNMPTTQNFVPFIYVTGSYSSSACDVSTIPEPPATEPDTCSNAVQDPDEDGFNCGGPCASECDSLACPEGMSPGGEGCVSDDENDVIKRGDAYGSCPDGTVVIPGQMANVTTPDCIAPSLLTDDAGACQGDLVVSAVMYYGTSICGPKSVVYSSDDPIPDLEYTPPDTSEYKKGSLSVVSSESSQTVDNGDGTSTVTMHTSKEAEANSGTVLNSTKTVTNIVDNSTGAVISSTTTVNEDTAVEDNPENYKTTFSVPDANVYDADVTDMLPEQQNIPDMIEGYLDQLPIMSALDNFSISSEFVECDMYIGEVFGTVLSIDMCRWESVLRALGSVFLIVAQISALLIVVGGLRK